MGNATKLTDIVALREATSEDVNFIFSSWLKSYRSSDFAKCITDTIYFEYHHDVIENLIATSQVIVACDKKKPHEIYGYMVAQVVDNIFTIHYTYVKQPFRRIGIADLMFKAFDHNPDHVACYSHETFMARRLAPRYRLVHHPYLMIPRALNAKNKNKRKS